MGQSAKKTTTPVEEAPRKSGFSTSLHCIKMIIDEESGWNTWQKAFLVDANVGTEGMLTVIDMLCDENCTLDKFSTGGFCQPRNVNSMEDDDLRRLINGCLLKRLCIACDDLDAS